jgi:hypothetical protein
MSARSDPARARNRIVWEAGDWDQIAPHIEAAGVDIETIGRVGDAQARRPT